MENAVTETKRIRKLTAYLREQTADKIIARTTIVDGGWKEIESWAESAGFTATRWRNPEYEAKREFADCYVFTRNKK